MTNNLQTVHSARADPRSTGPGTEQTGAACRVRRLSCGKTQPAAVALAPSGAAQQLLGQSCLNCHSQVHGSNHPWRAGSCYANAAYGTMAQAPDNQFQALSLSRVMALGEQTTLSATPIRGRLQQDELLLPFSSVFVAAAPLPSDRLQGSIKTYNGAVIPAQATVVRRINPAEEKQSGAALPLRGLSKQRLRARQRCRRYPQQRVAAR